MKAALTISFVLAVFCSLAYCASNPDDEIVEICDAMSPKFGCDPKNWYNDDRLNCTEKGQYMAWTSKAVRSSCYVLKAGDNAAPVTSYEPGRLLSIHLKVACFKMNYRGLLIYAVDANNKRVGDWEVEDGDDADFMLPWTGNTSTPECIGSLMHSTAEIKPYLSVLNFKAPAKGTGKITFRTLIKIGDANLGAFYWPEKDLELTEAPAAEAQTLFKLGSAGQSCDDVCKAYPGYSCDEAALDNRARFSQEIVKETLCVLPLLSGCGSDASTYDPVKQYCYFPETDCSGQNRTAINTNCFSKSANVQRFCACSTKTGFSAADGSTSASSSSTSGSTSASTSDGVNNGPLSSASNLKGISALLVASMMFISPRTASIFLIFLGLSSAHNWVNTQSRSQGASLFRPHKPSTSEFPHVQVGPGQSFQVEWMTAHFKATYFAIVSQKHENWTRAISESLMNVYLNQAPADKCFDATSGKYMRLHRKDKDTLDNEKSRAPTVPNYFNKILKPGDPLYIYRDATLRGKVGSVANPNETNTFLAVFNSSVLAGDKRCEYKSEKFPWLLAVHKFVHTALQPAKPDVANFWMPKDAEYGRYIVQYFWHSYRDAIDVDYVPNKVDDVYGTKPEGVRWKRIDHCLFEDVVNVWEWSEVVTTPDWCLRRCETRSSCRGVNVVPIKAPKSVEVFTDRDNEWVYPQVYGSDIYVPWNITMGTSPFKNNPEVDRLLKLADTGRYMCYGVTPAAPSDTHDEFTLSKDPSDPIFYSTCYYPYRGNRFPGYDNNTSKFPTSDKGDWKYADKCVSCDAQTYNAFPAVVPHWEIPETCVNCDKEPRNPNPPNDWPTGILIEKKARCDGLGNFVVPAHHNCTSNQTTCVIPLIPAGRKDVKNNDIYLDECRQMAATDSRCSNHFFHIDPKGPQTCYCYSKEACCSTCSRNTKTVDATMYELETTADPTCANGVISDDKKFCCSASCGAGNCKASSGSAAGWCTNAAVIDRPCAKFGAPCQL